MYEEFRDCSTDEIIDMMLTDLGYVADIKRDYYLQWCDVGASSMERFLDELDNEQLTSVVEGLIAEAKDNYNNLRGCHSKGMGIRKSLEMALTEMYDYLHLNHDELTDEDYAELGEDEEIDEFDKECSDRLRCLRMNLEDVKKAIFWEEERNKQNGTEEKFLNGEMG